MTDFWLKQLKNKQTETFILYFQVLKKNIVLIFSKKKNKFKIEKKIYINHCNACNIFSSNRFNHQTIYNNNNTIIK